MNELTSEELTSLRQALKKRKEELALVQIKRKEDRSYSEVLRNKEHLLLEEIRNVEGILANSIPCSDTLNECVRAEDTVILKLTYPNGEEEEDTFKLTFNYYDQNDKITNISINSEIGSTIYNQKIGTELVSPKGIKIAIKACIKNEEMSR